MTSPLRPRHRQESGIAAAGRLAHRGTPYYGASLSFATTTHLWPLPDPPSRKPPQRITKPHWGPPGQFRAAPLPLRCWIPPIRAPGQDSHLRSQHPCPAHPAARLAARRRRRTDQDQLADSKNFFSLVEGMNVSFVHARGRDAGCPAAPRADPSERNYRTGLLPWVRASKLATGQECVIGRNGSHRSRRRRIRCQVSRVRWLRRRSAMKPVPHCLGTERVERPLIARHAVVVGAPAKDAGEPASLLRHGPVAAAQQLAPEGAQLHPRPLRVGDALQHEASVSRRRADMREAKEVERLRLAETPLCPCRAANRPNWISRVFSAFSSKLNFASLSRRSAQNRSASSRCSNPTTR